MLFNSTTWEEIKRDQIPYLRQIDPNIRHPFHKGVWQNVQQMFAADIRQPVNWEH
jgi:hypothetical protein